MKYLRVKTTILRRYLQGHIHWNELLFLWKTPTKKLYPKLPR